MRQGSLNSGSEVLSQKICSCLQQNQNISRSLSRDLSIQLAVTNASGGATTTPLPTLRAVTLGNMPTPVLEEMVMDFAINQDYPTTQTRKHLGAMLTLLWNCLVAAVGT